MATLGPFDLATRRAEDFLRDHDLATLPINPMAIARDVMGVLVQAKDPASKGVSGMLVQHGNDFAIAYATHIDSEGFQRFSVAHELGHLLLPGHVDRLFSGAQYVHESRAHFVSTDHYELEADHFAAGLLMPGDPFRAAMLRAGDGFLAIESLANLCATSLTATAINYAKHTDLPVAVVVSEGATVRYAFMSESFKEIPEMGDWLRKDQPLPKDTPTWFFNRDAGAVERGERREATSSPRDWFNGETDFELNEDVVGLGSYGRTLTVLFPGEGVDLEAEGEDQPWEPRLTKSRRRA